MKAGKIKVPEWNRQKLQLFAEAYSLNEHLQTVQYLDVQIQGRQKATMVSVCEKGNSSCISTCA